MANEAGDGAPRPQVRSVDNRPAKVQARKPATAPAVHAQPVIEAVAPDQLNAAWVTAELQVIRELQASHEPVTLDFLRAFHAHKTESIARGEMPSGTLLQSQSQSETTEVEAVGSKAASPLEKASAIVQLMGCDVDSYEPGEVMQIAALYSKRQQGIALTGTEEALLRQAQGWGEEDYLTVAMAGGGPIPFPGGRRAGGRAGGRGGGAGVGGGAGGGGGRGGRGGGGGGSGGPVGRPPRPPGGGGPRIDPDVTRGQNLLNNELGGGGGFTLYLSPRDVGWLERDSEGWLNSQYDQIYRNAKQGNVLTSPVLTMLQQKYAFAASALGELHMDSERFTENYSSRLHAIYLRSAIENGNMQEVNQITQMLRTHGLLYALSLDNGNVARMWSAMDELLESERLAQHGLINDVEKKLLSDENDLLSGLTTAQRDQLRSLLKLKMHVRLDPKTGEPVSESSDQKKTRETRAVGEIYDFLQVLPPTATGPLINAYRSAYADAVARHLTGDALKADVIAKMPNILEKLQVNILGQERVAREMRQFHVTNEMMSRLQDNLIVKQLGLAKSGVGPYGADYQDAISRGLSPDEAESEVGVKITRAVRTAYDIFVDSQRAGVITARGHALGYRHMLKSDPITLFGVFNIKDFLVHRKQFTGEEDKFLRALEIRCARSYLKGKAKGMTDDQLAEYGVRKFRDIAEVSDFFSSSWRTMHILDALKQRIDYENGKRRAAGLSLIDVEDFGLALRFPKSQDKPESALTPGEYERLPVLSRIAEIRPEELVRLYRERAEGNTVLEGQLGQFFDAPAFAGLRVLNPDGTVNYFRTYDNFKDKLGPLINTLRQTAYRDFRAMRIGRDGFNPAEEQQIKNYFTSNPAELTAVFGAGVTVDRAPAKIQQMFQQFTTVAKTGLTLDPATGKEKAGSGVIHELMENNAFEDFYMRPTFVDDALLDILEIRPAGSDLSLLSEQMSNDPTSDPLARAFRDLDQGTQGATALKDFVKARKFEDRSTAAMKFGEAAYNYSGQNLRAQAIRFTLGSTIDLAAEDFWWDVLAVAQGPFRIETSELQRIFGTSAESMSIDQRYQAVQDIRQVLVLAVDRNVSLEEQAAETAQMYMWVEDLRKAARIKGKDFAKIKATGGMLGFLLAALIEGVRVFDPKTLNAAAA